MSITFTSLREGYYQLPGQSTQVSKIADLQEELAEVERDLMLRKLLWESMCEWSELVERWKETPFVQLNVNVLQKEVTRFVQTMHLLEKGK